jgi:hypothetical protein
MAASRCFGNGTDRQFPDALMEFVTALRILWRRRWAVAAFVLLAILMGVLTAFRFTPPTKLESKRYYVGIGSVTALVDTPKSQIVDLGGGETTGADIATLSARASLLASVMTNSPIKDEIAAAAGIRSEDLIAIPPASSEPGAGTAPAPDSAKLSDPKANVLKTTIPSLETGQIPIISVSTQAPTAETAAKLANASIKILQKHLTTVAGTDAVPSDRRIVVRQLGPARSSLESRGPGNALAIAVVFLVVLFGCGAILGLTALIGGWRRASELEKLPPAARRELELVLDREPEPVLAPAYHQHPRPRPTPVPEPEPEPESSEAKSSSNWASL